MKKFLYFTVMALLAAGILILGGCPKIEDDESIDPALVGNWSNEAGGNDLRTFTIEKNGSFSASLAPYETPGKVTGKLTKDGDNYRMSKLEEKTGASWGAAVGGYSGTPVQIELTGDKKTFELKCKDNPMVTQFFGGTYHRK